MGGRGRVSNTIPRREQVWIDSELRQDAERPVVAVFADDRRRVGGASEGVGCAAESVALEQRERRWIPAVDRRPVVEATARAVTQAGAHSQERGEVERFLVDMEHVGAQLGD